MTADDPRPAGEAAHPSSPLGWMQEVVGNRVRCSHCGEETPCSAKVRLHNASPEHRVNCVPVGSCYLTCRPLEARPAASGGATDGERELSEAAAWASTIDLIHVYCGRRESEHPHGRFYGPGPCGFPKKEWPPVEFKRAPVVSQADNGLREEIARLAVQWDDMGQDHAEQGFETTALVYRAHARLLRRALDGHPL